MDIVLDLWIHAIYNDTQVQGSDIGPVVYFRNHTGDPLTCYQELAGRWNISKETHDTLKLLKNYRDAVWNLELDIQHVRMEFEIEYGNSIEEFLDSIYLAGADLNGTKLENYAKSIERSNRMPHLLTSAVDILRNRHKYGE